MLHTTPPQEFREEKRERKNDFFILISLICFFSKERICFFSKEPEHTKRENNGRNCRCEHSEKRTGIMNGVQLNNGLHSACLTGKIEIVKSLIQYAIGHGITMDLEGALTSACHNGDIRIIMSIVTHGKRILFPLNWNQGLRGACYGGHLKIVELMIRLGADGLEAALFAACAADHMKIVEFLVKRGADPNFGMYGAAQSGNAKIVNFLFEKGANDVKSWQHGNYVHRTRNTVKTICRRREKALASMENHLNDLVAEYKI